MQDAEDGGSRYSNAARERSNYKSYGTIPGGNTSRITLDRKESSEHQASVEFGGSNEGALTVPPNKNHMIESIEEKKDEEDDGEALHTQQPRATGSQHDTQGAIFIKEELAEVEDAQETA